jgi:hypothetical protein
MHYTQIRFEIGNLRFFSYLIYLCNFVLQITEELVLLHTPTTDTLKNPRPMAVSLTPLPCMSPLLRLTLRSPLLPFLLKPHVLPFLRLSNTNFRSSAHPSSDPNATLPGGNLPYAIGVPYSAHARPAHHPDSPRYTHTSHTSLEEL